MRRTLTSLAATAACLAVALTGALPAGAADGSTPGATGASPEPSGALVEGEALAVADRVLEGRARTQDPSPTLALRDLFVARPRLSGAERRRADRLLARPSDPSGSPDGSVYTVDSKRRCNPRICVHYVPTTADAPPSRAWVDRTLAVMQATWKREISDLGYRRPVRDGRRGGDDRFDVYLVDLDPGMYGYCATEKRSKRRTASGYCVLDNDYRRADFPSGTPLGNLKVTAAHEFFHAVQFAHDYAEDTWMMESTATWMEERVADGINDNRQYLPHSQLAHPQQSLDHSSSRSGSQYGNWIFWEHLSLRYGRDVVKRAWKQAGSLPGDGGRYSLQALDKVLSRQGGLKAVHPAFLVANVNPRLSYPEGSAYTPAAPYARVRLSKARRSTSRSVRINHLAGRTVQLVPDPSLGAGWKVAVRVRGAGAPAARLVVHRTDGSVKRLTVALGRTGTGGRIVAFDSRKVASVTVVLANASTRMRCDRRPRTGYACGGVSPDDDSLFKVSATARR